MTGFFGVCQPARWPKLLIFPVFFPVSREIWPPGERFTRACAHHQCGTAALANRAQYWFDLRVVQLNGHNLVCGRIRVRPRPAATAANAVKHSSLLNCNRAAPTVSSPPGPGMLLTDPPSFDSVPLMGSSSRFCSITLLSSRFLGCQPYPYPPQLVYHHSLTPMVADPMLCFGPNEMHPKGEWRRLET